MNKRFASILLALMLILGLALPAAAGGSNPITLQAAAMSEYVSLQWTPDSAGGLSGYYVYRSTQPGSASGAAANDFPCTETSFKDYNVEQGVLYYYTVCPVYGTTIGSPSNEVQVRFGATDNSMSPGITIIMEIGNPQMTVNGVSQLIDPPSGQAVPLLVKNRTFVPIGAIVSALGGTLSYDANTRMVTIAQDSSTINLWIDSKNIRVNGVDQVMDVAPFISNSRTYLPLIFVLNNLNCATNWDGSLYRITITRGSSNGGSAGQNGSNSASGSTTSGAGSSTGTSNNPVIDFNKPSINGPTVDGNITPEPPKQILSWTGSWSTSYGVLNLTQNGDQVTGSYPDGTLTGTVSGNILSGTFAEVNDYTGVFSFTMSGDGKSFTGTWHYAGDAEDGNWSGTRITD